MALFRYHNRLQHRPILTLLACGGLLLGVTACGDSETRDSAASDTSTTSGAEDTVIALDAQLADIGLVADPGSLACEDTPATEGATLNCEFTSAGQPTGLDAKVVAVDGPSTEFEIVTHPRPIPVDLLATTVSTDVGNSLGVVVDSTECDGDLQPEVGQIATCTITLGQDSLKGTVTVTAVNGGQVDYAIDQAAS